MNIKTIFILLIFFTNYSLSNNLLSKEPISKPEKEKFMFLINSDPQMGEVQHKESDTYNSELKILNELLSMFVKETNKRKGKDKPDFVVWNGDLVWKPLQIAFDNFVRIVSEMKIPSVLVHGNHDGVKEDPKFLNAQEKLSGYRKLHYSFDYGQWHFVVIASQDKYLTRKKKKDLLKWLKQDLKNNKDKKTMLFMHYHILPTGISQMEFYGYSPLKFRNQMLDTITKYGNVKYVFSGHVHIGVKAAIKTARNYKGTNFILCPTPVFPRPYGEEYEQYSKVKKKRFDKRGFYMEVHVEGEEVSLIGRKINHPFKVPFPKKFKKFTQSEDLRAFVTEGNLPVNNQIINNSFDEGLKGWRTSWRYQQDDEPIYNNPVLDGQNHMKIKTKYGSWTTDEYMENYQVVKMQNNNHISIDFKIPTEKFEVSGGYIRIFAYDKLGDLKSIIIFHWGDKENKVRFIQQSWAFNTTGKRMNALWLNRKIKNNVKTYTLPVKANKNHLLDIDLDHLFTNNEEENPINHYAIAYGVWAGVNKIGTSYSSEFTVNEITTSNTNNTDYPAAILFDNKIINQLDEKFDYGEYYAQ